MWPPSQSGNYHFYNIAKFMDLNYHVIRIDNTVDVSKVVQVLETAMKDMEK